MTEIFYVVTDHRGAFIAEHDNLSDATVDKRDYDDEFRAEGWVAIITPDERERKIDNPKHEYNPETKYP
jgi:hypothetical protein